MPSVRDAWLAGIAAFKEGKATTDCPYHVTDHEYDHWQDGWKFAKAQQRPAARQDE